MNNKNKQGRKNYKENIGTKLITNTKKQKLKIQSRVWNFKNTTLKKKKKKKKEREKKNKNKKTNKNKQGRINYKKKKKEYRYNIDNKYQKP